MKASRRMLASAMFLTALVFAPAIRAEADPAPAALPVLKAIPDDALGFVLVNNLAQTDKAISNLAAKLQAPLPDVLSMFKSQAGIKEGLDENGSAAIAFLPDKPAEAGKPAAMPVVLFPVTDYKKFIAQFQPDDATAETTGVTIAGHALIVGHKDSFAVFTLPNFKEQLAKAIASTKGVDSLLATSESWIGRHQISAVATPSGSKMLFSEAAEALKQAEGFLAKTQKNPQQSAQVVAGLEIYRKVLAKASEQVDAFGIGIALDESSNLSIDSHTTFVAGGDWAAAMKDLKPMEGNIFAGIAARPFVFAGGGMIPESWASGLADFSASSVAQMNTTGGGLKLTEQQRKEFVEAMRSMLKGTESMAFVMASPKPGGSFLDGSMGITKVDDTKDYLARYQKSTETVSEITKDQAASPFKFASVKKIEIDGHDGLEFTMDMSGMFAAMKNPESAKLMPALFGPNGKITARMVAADDHTIITSYGGEEHAKEALAAFKKPQSNFASDPNVAATLKLLPPHAQWVGVVSIKGYLDFVSGIVATALPGVPMKLPELPAMPPIGFSGEAVHGGLETQMLLPVETLVSLSNVIRGAMRPHAAPPNN